MEKIVALTVVAELPHDFEMDKAAVFAFDSGEPWQGWTSSAMARLIGYPEANVEGRTPSFRLVFRRTKVRSRLPLYAADRTFGGWVAPFLGKRRRIRRKAGLSLARLFGMREMVTVVAITAFPPLRLIPEPNQRKFYSSSLFSRFTKSRPARGFVTGEGDMAAGRAGAGLQ